LSIKELTPRQEFFGSAIFSAILGLLGTVVPSFSLDLWGQPCFLVFQPCFHRCSRCGHRQEHLAPFKRIGWTWATRTGRCATASDPGVVTPGYGAYRLRRTPIRRPPSAVPHPPSAGPFHASAYRLQCRGVGAWGAGPEDVLMPNRSGMNKCPRYGERIAPVPATGVWL